MLTNAFPKIPTRDQLMMLTAKAGEEYEKEYDRGLSAKKQVKERKQLLFESKARAFAASESFENDIGELETLRAAHARAAKRVRSPIARDVIVSTREALRVEEALQKNAAKLANQFQKACAAYNAARVAYDQARLRCTQLSFVSELQQFPSRKEDQGLLALIATQLSAPMLKPGGSYAVPAPGPNPPNPPNPPSPPSPVTTPRPAASRAAHGVAGFDAFKGVQELEYVQEALVGELAEFNGICLSMKAVDVPGLPRVGRHAGPSTVAPDGTLCVVDRSRDGATLYVTNLLSGREAHCAISDVAWAAVCGGELFVGILKQACIHYAPLDAFYAGLPFQQFRSFAVAGAFKSAAFDRLGEGAAVFHCGLFTNRLVCVDFRAKTSRAVECDRLLNTIGSLAAIPAPGALCMACKSVGNNETLVVLADGRTEEVARGLGWFPTLLPSAAAPADLTRAAVIDWEAKVWYAGRTADLRSPVKPLEGLPPVRLHRDVFLCVDEASARWVALRIAVP